MNDALAQIMGTSTAPGTSQASRIARLEAGRRLSRVAVRKQTAGVVADVHLTRASTEGAAIMVKDQGSLVPAVRNAGLTLGTQDNPWDVVYAKSVHVIGGSSTSSSGGLAPVRLPVYGPLLADSAEVPGVFDVATGTRYTLLTALCGTGPVGAAMNITIVKNGVDWISTTIADGATSVAVIGAWLAAVTDKITIKVTQVGSTTAGADLVVVLS